MRMNTALWYALVAACSFAACSWGGSSSGTPSNSPDASTVSSTCGDGVCVPSEIGYCEMDCPSGHGSNGSGSGSGSSTAPFCGNGVCEAGETVATCQTDCNTGSGSGSGSGSGGALDCNDPNVQVACLACLFANSCTGVDQGGCTTCLLQGALGSGAGSGLGDDSGCVGGAPNGTCDTGETPANCVDDCI